MAMSKIWAALALAAFVFGLVNGKIGEVSAAALEGASSAVTLVISIAGVMCLWTGVLEVMKRSGLASGLARLMRPVLGMLFPGHARGKDEMEAISANISANLLGLGNAATPLGIKAVQLMAAGEKASDDLCMFVVLNTASIQLIPATVAGLRAALGSASPFDILPAVWFTSALSVSAGIISAVIMRRFVK
jgi:spore maturation protein A